MSTLVLGAPGVYRTLERSAQTYGGVRLDVTGFVGIAPRGPVDEAIRVDNWTEYVRRFGAYEGSGRLPYAVSAYFDQGGERAYVVRVAPRADAGDATATHELTGLEVSDGPRIRLAAADEGSWGNGLQVRLDFEVVREFRLDDGRDEAVARGDELTEVPLPGGVAVPTGTLVRLRSPGGDAALRWVVETDERHDGLRRIRFARLDRSVDVPRTDHRATTVSVIEGMLAVDDADRRFRRTERHTGVGLHPEHPRWIWSVVETESFLLDPLGDWSSSPVSPASGLLPSASSVLRTPGRDRDTEIRYEDFVDGRWQPLAERRRRGVHALMAIEEIGLLVLPDLLRDSSTSASPPPIELPSPSPPFFVRCATHTTLSTVPPPQSPLGDLVDSRTPEGLEEAISRQTPLVELAEQARRFTVLLDVPRGLSLQQVGRWRGRFDSRFAAAYHPWPEVDRNDDERPASVDVPPSAFAAGIIAARERRRGLPAGPANELAVGAIALATPVRRDEHDLLHPVGINVFVQERDGIRLTAARTMSVDRSYRQLTVSRLMTMLRLTLERDFQWMVFETHTPTLWATVRFQIGAFLRRLYEQGAFVGASDEDAFFVHCDERLNPFTSRDTGRLLVEVGVAPSEPLEFLVLRIERNNDGNVRVEEARG